MARMSSYDTGISISGYTDISGQASKLYFGAGYVGGNWPTEPRYKQTAAATTSGDIAAIVFTWARHRASV